MSEKLTRIRLRRDLVPKGGGGGYGLQDWGEHSFEEMWRQIRDKASRDMETATRLLAAKKEDFEVDIVRGPYVQHHIRKVLPKEE